MNDSKVKVTAHPEGYVVVRGANNPKWGYIRVEQIRMNIDDKTGIAKREKVSALIPGLVTDLKGFGFADGQEISGKIRIVEQLIPFNKKDPDKDLKVAGNSGVVCCVGDEPIYRKHFYTQNEALADVKIHHDNDDEIKAARAELNEEIEVNGNVADDLDSL